MKIYKIAFSLCLALLSVFIATILHASGEIVKAGATAAIEEGKQSADMRDLLIQMEKQSSDFNSLKTDFTQEKDLAVFRNKIIIKGRIYLQKPRTVAWHVDEPLKYSVLITDKLIRQWDEDTNQVQEIPLSKNPMFRVVIDQLTAWFSGRYVQLLDDYTVSSKKTNPLEIEFIPRETGNMKKIIKAITVTFREDRKYLQKVQFDEVSGDSTTITFKNTIFNAPIDSADLEVKGRV
ncbi:MAG: outer membrane lipoprotein carrier protein LolA [Nitrospirae bacterium]|nr:outer membrane lipoprotein carrier protein LolA [Nitrospirota bacterium]